MKKQIFSLLLTLCLLAGLLPTVAYAAGPSGTMLTKDILDSTYKVDDSFGSYYYCLPTGHYYLGGNISVDKSIYIGHWSEAADVTLELNGYELKKDTEGTLLYPQNNSTLTLTDSSSSKMGKVISTSNRVIVFNSGNKFYANGGTVEGNVTLDWGDIKIDNTDHSNVTVFRNGTILSGNSSTVINGGIFYSSVDNYRGQITGGIFYGEVSDDATIADSAKVTMAFNSDGGTPVTEQKILRGRKATEPAYPTKAGYSFEGWYNGDTKFDFANTPVTENITLTAKWSEKSEITFDIIPQSYTYNGTAQAFSITGTAVTGFDIVYEQSGQIVTNPTNAGSYDVIITRAEDDTYKAVDVTINGGLVINPKAVTATISVIPDVTYTGSNIEPTITAYDNTNEIPASEYTVVYTNNTDAGTATVALIDNIGGNYVVSGSTTFEILPKSIENAVINLNGALTYNGTEQTQNVTVTLDGFNTLTFDVSGNKQTDVNSQGNYTLTVTGKGNFTGSKNLDWNITPATPAENPAKKTTARVARSRTLADATVTNGEVLALDGTTSLTGTFAWVDTTKVMSIDGTEQMIFTPESTNYAPITIDVAVSTYSTGGGGGSYNPTKFTIKFDTNGGTDTENKTVVKNNKATSPTAPTRDGYIFDGWYTDKELTQKYDFETKVTSNLTLYAKWLEEKWENPFKDISDTDWFYEDAVYVYSNGLMVGTSTTAFSPDATTTRGMVVTILYRLEGSPAVSSSCPFGDVDSNAYYKDAITWAVSNGIAGGYSSDLFGPNDNITREQLATLLYRYAKYKGLDVSVGEDTNILSYNDAFNISEYAVPAMQWLCGEGIMSGNNVNLMPMKNATRAEIAALLHRFCENIVSD